MSYRKSFSSELDQWRKSNSRELVLLGLPEIIVADHGRFVRAIEEGEDHATKWHIGWIKSENHADLYRLLSEKFSKSDSYLVSDLEEQLTKFGSQES